MVVAFVCTCQFLRAGRPARGENARNEQDKGGEGIGEARDRRDQPKTSQNVIVTSYL